MNNPPDDELIDLVAEALGQLEAGGDEALEAFLEEHSEQAPIIRRRLELLTASGLDVDSAERTSVPEILGDFRLESPIGQGGMGVVWRATQLSLGREVACKLVRPDQLLFPGSRDRFQREVETIARLEHPGIVPVYAVGEERGIPFFAMELVRGASLAECLRELSEAGISKPTGADLRETLPDDGSGDERGAAFFEGSWPEVTARIAREVAEALEHALRRGIVHRDVKPSNVMLTRGGRVLLLDFGLSSRSGDPRITRTGSAVGSLAYLAPEYHGSSSPEGDTRQDVYSLGVSLFELLTLSPAFEVTTDLQLIEAKSRGTTAPLGDRAPRDLAAIVAVAMDHDPARRYAHPGDMARDLGNFLEHRPIEAQPPGTALRVLRWTQRHPVLALLTTAAVLVPSLLFAQEMRSSGLLRAKSNELEAANAQLETTNETLATTNAELDTKRLELVDALAKAEASRDQARKMLEKSMDAVDTMLAQVGDESLESIPGMQSVRRELLEEAHEFQEWFLTEAGTDPALQARSIDVALRSSQVQSWLGDIEAMKLSVDRAEQLARASLAEGGTRSSVAISQLNDVLRMRAREANYRGNYTAALASLDEALELSKELDEESRLFENGDTHLQRAVAFQRLGRLEPCKQALKLSEAAFESTREAFFAGDDEHTSATESLAAAKDQLGMIYSSLSYRQGNEERQEDAHRSYEYHLESVDLCEELLEEGIDEPTVRLRLVRALNSAASAKINVLPDIEDMPQYFPLVRRALELAQELTRDFPGVTVYLSDVATTSVNLANLEYNFGDPAQAIEDNTAGLGAFERLFELEPTIDANTRSGYAGAVMNHGWYVLDHTKNIEAGTVDILRGAAIWRDCIADSPNDPYIGGIYSRQVRNLTALMLKKGVLDVGEALFRDLENYRATSDQRLDDYRYYDSMADDFGEPCDAALGAVLEELLRDGRIDREAFLAHPEITRLAELPRIKAALAE